MLSRSFPQIAAAAAADIHPPGYYWLLKLWSNLFGAGAAAMRSFSALLGVVLVYQIYRIGRYFTPMARRTSWLALLAALLAALNPFQIYYSQEARMYMLLAVASAGAIWSLLAYLHAPPDDRAGMLALVGYTLAGTLGLWTHYSFPIVLLAAGLGYVVELLWRPDALWRQRLLYFVVANLVILLLFLPWLPTAIARVLAWPAGGITTALAEGIALTVTTLLLGPHQILPPPAPLWLALAVTLPVIGIIAWRQIRGVALLALWWALPIGLMFGAGLFTEAFLKFLLVASPPWLLLCAGAATLFPWPRIAGALLTIGALALAVFTLPTYYTDPMVRDNYAGVARYVAAVADPARDLVILNAPGQQEVWRYYDPGVPVLAVPQMRPADREATVATLAAATAERHNLYALFWATAEADPERVVEHWLDQHAFKGLERWQGNLRFVVYTLSRATNCTPPTPQGAVQWDAGIDLVAFCLDASPTVTAGEAALVGLQWQSTQPLTASYKVTVQLLDPRNGVVAQRDSEPVGGSRPTTSWQVGERIVDNHGVAIPVGTPPGRYRLIVALYDSATGVRLPVAGHEYWDAGAVTVMAPPMPLPAALVEVQHRVDRQVGPVSLVGYSAHRVGMAHAPQTPLVAGDLVEFTFVWQAPTPLPAGWPATLTATLQVGNATVTFPLAGENYPTAQWQAGQLLQYTVQAPFDGTSVRPQLIVAAAKVNLTTLPTP
jgi:4-amino-4-deoxy-L-arabinose transferase-like glycosyltransferase